MTNSTLLVSLIVGLVLAILIGLLARRFKNPPAASSIAFAVTAILALSVLLDHWREPLRLVVPGEAVEWIPLGLLALMAASLGYYFDKKRSLVWLVVGLVVCLVLPARLLFGSIYLRKSDLNPSYLVAILAWGLAAAWVWAMRVKNSELPFKLDGLLQIGGLLAVSGILGMTGSITYAAIGILMSLIAVGSWVGSGRPSPLISVVAIFLLGLGPTFAETAWLVVGLLALTIVFTTFASSLNKQRTKVFVIATAAVSMVIGMGLTVQKFRESITSQSQEASGYEAYR